MKFRHELLLRLLPHLNKIPIPQVLLKTGISETLQLEMPTFQAALKQITPPRLAHQTQETQAHSAQAQETQAEEAQAQETQAEEAQAQGTVRGQRKNRQLQKDRGVRSALPARVPALALAAVNLTIRAQP